MLNLSLSIYDFTTNGQNYRSYPLPKVTIKDFSPINTWKLGDGMWPGSSTPMYIHDMTTNNKYWYSTKNSVRLECVKLAIWMPLYTIVLISTVAAKTLKLIALTRLWEIGTDSLKDRVKNMGRDLFTITVSPIILVGVALSAIYGIFSPYNGRKLCASFERIPYDARILLLTEALNFQPACEIINRDINNI